MAVRSPSVITLTTDFGTRDTFVAEMKGVILSINPSAVIVDITHEIEPFNILEGAIKLSSVVKYFPPNSIHIAVIDPGVGSPRRPIIVETEKGFLIGPDNGVLSLAVRDEAIKGIYEIRIPGLNKVGPTFHGRDIFAPAGAWLSKGKGPEEIGIRIKDFVRLPIPEPILLERDRLRGEVLMIDRFGNAITNIKEGLIGSETFRVFIKGLEIPVFNYYSEAEGYTAGSLINSSGYLEIFRYRGSASDTLKIKTGDPVEVQKGR